MTHGTCFEGFGTSQFSLAIFAYHVFTLTFYFRISNPMNPLSCKTRCLDVRGPWRDWRVVLSVWPCVDGGVTGVLCCIYDIEKMI